MFTLPDTDIDIDTETDKNNSGLWRCSHCTERDTNADSHWVLSVLIFSICVWLDRGVGVDVGQCEHTI